MGIADKENIMKSHIAYLQYVLRHKWFVFLACRKLGVSLWQAIFHDWTKFRHREWFPYVRFFYTGEPSTKIGKEDYRFQVAWLHHQKTNKHHWQYWVLINDEEGVTPLIMPINYVMEMIADWDGAGRAINGKSDPADWYKRNGGKMILHPVTRSRVEHYLYLYYGWQEQPNG